MVATTTALTGMATVGAIWWATGWAGRRRDDVSASVFFTLFAANESARTWVTHIMIGSACGGAASVLFVVLLPYARSPPATGLLAAPFLLAGAWAMARPATGKAAIDFNMVFLLATPTAVERAAETIERTALGIEKRARVSAAAESLRDAAWIIRREESSFAG